MKSIFESVNMTRPRSSGFDLSHEKKLSMNMGDLIPTLVQEVVPGDHFKGKTETMIRLAPMLAPVMHRVNVYMHYFFVPNRILWSQWEDFITGGKEGTTMPGHPFMNLDASRQAIGSLADYMGLPTGGTGTMGVNALPFWAYNKIFNEFYRDETLQSEAPLNTSAATSALVLKRCWEKDYFTSALPWPQRGPDVNIPISSDPADNPGIIRNQGTGGSAGATGNLYQDAGGYLRGASIPSELLNIKAIDEEIQFTMNEFRTSNALQRWLEKQARGGYRYIETILSHFGVKSSDTRLQRPEYLGGGKSPVVISEVLNTTGTVDAPQGAMAGHGIATGSSNSFNYKAEEHGWIIGIMSVMPRTAYQQGLNRKWTRVTKLDYYWPEFANLGEQEIKSRELYFKNEAADSDTFGYQQRYAEYKYEQDSVHGEFRDTLDFWHMGRIFSTRPALNADFVKANPTERIFAVAGGDKLWCQLYCDIKAKRPMPFFSNPSL